MLAKNEVKFPGVIEKKSCANIHWSWFLTLEFRKGVRKFLENFRDVSLFSLEFPGKVTNIIFKIASLQRPVWIFSGRVQYQ